MIELLIVVAIIAILAAIAVPNFLEAQTRAKVSAVKSDIRTLAGALEIYFVDNNAYPPHLLADGGEVEYPDRYYYLTTPVAYLNSIPGRDPFYRFTETTAGSGATGFRIQIFAISRRGMRGFRLLARTAGCFEAAARMGSVNPIPPGTAS